MKYLKKNQIVIYAISLMLVVAGYLNYTNTNQVTSLETSIQEEYSDDTQIADIGDATLVSSNDIIELETEETLDSNITNEEEIETVANSDNDEYFVKSKLERDTMYSQMLEIYENILNSTNSLETQKQSATEEIKKINENKNKIMICENLIGTKGFENVVIFINNESVSIIVETEELLSEQIAQIQNIISREMNVEIENIHISKK
jgi:stage III sporulation protein AH